MKYFILEPHRKKEVDPLIHNIHHFEGLPRNLLLSWASLGYLLCYPQHRFLFLIFMNRIPAVPRCVFCRHGLGTFPDFRSRQSHEVQCGRSHWGGLHGGLLPRVQQVQGGPGAEMSLELCCEVAELSGDEMVLGCCKELLRPEHWGF